MSGEIRHPGRNVNRISVYDDRVHAGLLSHLVHRDSQNKSYNPASF
jgi:hypothetical protein